MDSAAGARPAMAAAAPPARWAPSARWAAGVACILMVAVIWTFATVLKQIIFNDLDYDEPLVLAYVCNACYVVHFPLFALGRFLGLVKRVPWRRRPTSRGPAVEQDGQAPQHSSKSAEVAGSSAREAFLAGLLIAPIWFAAQWTYSAGVAQTSVTSSTVISATSVVWTFLASVLFAGERLSLLKSVGVLACLAGNAATQLGDLQSGRSGQAVGDLLCLLSAVCYAAYTTILKRLAGEETSVALLFGALGLAVSVLGAPLLLLFGREALARLTPKLLGLLIFNGIFDNVLSQYAWAKAVQWTSPTAATVGLSLTIPLSIVADLIRRHPPSGWSYLAGVLVVLGFCVVTLATKPQQAVPAAAPSSAEAGLSPRTPLSSAPGEGRCEIRA